MYEELLTYYIASTHVTLISNILNEGRSGIMAGSLIKANRSLVIVI